jgi:predicted RNase H-like nuclease (RuvC/YqgF family)
MTQTAQTNAEKQAAFRKRRQQERQELEATVEELKRQLEQGKAEREELQRQLSALAGIIADAKAQQ